MSGENNEFRWGPKDSNTDNETTRDKSQADSDTDDQPTREKPQYAMSLDPELKRHLNDTFEKFNADQTNNDKPRVEKHKHFNQGLIECALENNWREHVQRRFEETSV